MVDIEIKAEAQTSLAAAYIGRFDFRLPSEHVVRNRGTYNLNLALAPRPKGARGAYSRHWRSDRFEPLGSLCMLPPHETVMFRSDPGATTCLICDIDPQAASQWLDQDMEWEPAALEGTLDMVDMRVRALLVRLSEEIRHPGFASEAMIDLLSAQIALELSRCHKARREMATDGGVSASRLRKIDDRLADEGARPSLVELADLCGLSVRQLSRSFKAARGISIGSYLAAHRLELAKTLLGAGRSLKVIAHDLGFGSPASFGYAFRAATGTTPSAYREALRRAA